MMNPRPVIHFLLIVLTGCIMPVNGQHHEKGARHLQKIASKRSGSIPALFSAWKHTGDVVADSIRVRKAAKVLEVFLSPSATHIPVRTAWISHLDSSIRASMGRPFRDYRILLYARGRLLEAYVPNFYRDPSSVVDSSRIPAPYRGRPLVTSSDQAFYAGGLSGNHLAIWPSHGYFFDQQLDRWQWQRARLWQTVEDVFPWSFTSHYLVPMLESAGATVLLPRERDIQTNEVIVDNDLSTGRSQLITQNGKNTWASAGKGFAMTDTLYSGQNPFESGCFLRVIAEPGDTATLTYLPDIPESGDYAVYASWAKTDQCITKVRYEIRYSGGKASFSVNQCMGAGTWIYLGTFHFNAGMNRDAGSLIVYAGDEQGIVTADAVRFGGGMGNVARKPGLVAEPREKSVNNGSPSGNEVIPIHSDQYRYKLSEKPRWMEGSRYYLQYAGMPDSLIYNLNSGRNDYNDDYMSRGEWVNFLIGPAKPQYNDKYRNGLGIPVDLALAFHTDAGVTENDSVIGTLGIYSTVRNNGLFPGGQSKLASRDLSDIIQTQVVGDLVKQVNPQWTRRGLWDREYSEAWRPIVPVMLLELLSHQNLADMRYGLDPRFRFVVSRAVYKGILRYLSVQEGREAVIQPLPPDHMAIEIVEGRTIRLSWRPVRDTLESSAMPTGYKVYMKTGSNGYDQGQYTRDTLMIVTLPEWGQIYGFRVTALNEGGESFPGETLSASLFPEDEKPVLVVNAFDRICGPEFFDLGEMAGIAWWDDQGVGHGNDLGHTGNQYDYNRDSPWLHDDSQGWGASHADMETMPVPGNTFYFPAIHGEALSKAGYSFVSVSDEVFTSSDFISNEYRVVDLIFGEERGTPSLINPSRKDFRVFTPAMMEAISRHTRNGGNIFLSGAYIGTDMAENHDSLAILFAAGVLHYTWRTSHATTVGLAETTDQARDLFPEQLMFNTGYHADIYRIESPDAIEPAGEGAFRIYRYGSGKCSAGVAYKGSYRSVALGFPFETILAVEQRVALMSAVMAFFNEN